MRGFGSDDGFGSTAFSNIFGAIQRIFADSRRNLPLPNAQRAKNYTSESPRRSSRYFNRDARHFIQKNSVQRLGIADNRRGTPLRRQAERKNSRIECGRRRFNAVGDTDSANFAYVIGRSA